MTPGRTPLVAGFAQFKDLVAGVMKLAAMHHYAICELPGSLMPTGVMSVSE
jgi:hypothetical protein